MDATSTASVNLYPAPARASSAADARGGATVIAVSGDLRSAGFAALDRLMTEALDHGHRHVVLDLHSVPSIEPQALGLLWAALRGVRRRGGTLAAAEARPPLRPALKALSSGGLPLYDTVGAAVSASHNQSARS
jgi:anti-anti-sigma factor